jgi:hypothetical protein
MKIVIVESPGNAVVGVIDNWELPVPGKGDYIFHPPFNGGAETNVMSVKTVTWRMLTRPERGSGAGHFTGHPEPYVEIHV